MNMHNTAEPHPYCRKWMSFQMSPHTSFFAVSGDVHRASIFFAVCLFGNGLPIIVFVGWMGTRYTSSIMKSMFFLARELINRACF